MENKIASLERKVCVSCGNQYDTGALLISQNLNKGFAEMYQVTGFGMCEECKKRLIEADHVLLVEMPTQYEVDSVFELPIEDINPPTEGHAKFLKENRWAAIDYETARMLKENINGTHQ